MQANGCLLPALAANCVLGDRRTIVEDFGLFHPPVTYRGSRSNCSLATHF